MKARSIFAIAAVLVCGAIGCDPSKPELEKTKSELQTVTTERDNLKSQLDQANAKVQTLTQQVTELQAKAAAATPPPAAEEKKPEGKHASKGKVGKAPTAAEKKEIEAHPQTRSGRGAF